MIIGNTKDIILIISCIEKLLEVSESQQDLLRELADNYGIEIGVSDDEKLQEIHSKIDILKT